VSVLVGGFIISAAHSPLRAKRNETMHLDWYAWNGEDRRESQGGFWVGLGGGCSASGRAGGKGWVVGLAGERERKGGARRGEARFAARTRAGGKDGDETCVTRSDWEVYSTLFFFKKKSQGTVTITMKYRPPILCSLALILIFVSHPTLTRV
jgi:hypothetical protein